MQYGCGDTFFAGLVNSSQHRLAVLFELASGHVLIATSAVIAALSSAIAAPFSMSSTVTVGDLPSTIARETASSVATLRAFAYTRA